MPASDADAYTGRFAPSPTGPLHFGSLMAAVASYLEARARDGRWLVRIEDIDPPREQPGADTDIVRMLDAYGFEWDGPVHYQSQSADQHRASLDALAAAGLTYKCRCSRRDLAAEPRGPLGVIYPGTCRNQRIVGESAVRLRTDDRPVTVHDRLQGDEHHQLETESGDFVILRRDGLVAYQLAVVVDDALQGITDVVRGIDLIDSTPRQIFLQRCLGLATPDYAHIPVAENPDGSKLSKLTGAEPITVKDAASTLLAALSALQQAPPAELDEAGVAAIWGWAIENWAIDRMRGLKNIAVQHYC